MNTNIGNAVSALAICIYQRTASCMHTQVIYTVTLQPP